MKLTIIKNDNYTVMCNEHLRNKELSLKGKGLLSLMLSLPNDWNYSIKGLSAICKEGETTIKTTLDELKELGYLEIYKLSPKNGVRSTIQYEYVIYESVELKQECGYQGIESLPLEVLALENQGQINIEEINTKELNKENKKENIYTKEKKVFKKPTLEELQEYCNENNYTVDCEHFLDYYESNGWLIGKSKMKDWKATIRNWNRNNAKFNKTEKTYESFVDFDKETGSIKTFKYVNGVKTRID